MITRTGAPCAVPPIAHQTYPAADPTSTITTRSSTIRMRSPRRRLGGDGGGGSLGTSGSSIPDPLSPARPLRVEVRLQQDLSGDLIDDCPARATFHTSFLELAFGFFRREALVPQGDANAGLLELRGERFCDGGCVSTASVERK